MKIIKVDGMNCSKCQARVETALKNVEEVKSVKINLKEKEVRVKGDVKDELLINAITGAGYVVVNIKEKKGLFS